MTPFPTLPADGRDTPPRTTSADRRGFTLVELIVVAVLGTLVLGAIYQVLVTSQRSFGAQSDAVQARQSLRVGVAVLAGELRELSPADGDLVSMAAGEIHVRSNRALALFCSVVQDGPDPVVRARQIGHFLHDDSARVFYENAPNTTSDDRWGTAHLEVVDTTGALTCSDGRTAQDVRLRGVVFGGPPDSIVGGGLIRGLVHHRYGLETHDGRAYLARTDASGTARRLVGPLDPDRGVGFRYLDSLGTETTTAADVRQIEVVLRSAPDLRGSGDALRRDSLRTRVHVQN